VSATAANDDMRRVWITPLFKDVKISLSGMRIRLFEISTIIDVYDVLFLPRIRHCLYIGDSSFIDERNTILFNLCMCLLKFSLFVIR